MDDDERRTGQALKEQLDRELIAVGATESARERLRLALAEPPASRVAVRWAVPLATAAAVVGVVAVPAILRDRPEQQPVVPGVSVPAVEPTTKAPTPAPVPSRSLSGVPTTSPTPTSTPTGGQATGTPTSARPRVTITVQPSTPVVSPPPFSPTPATPLPDGTEAGATSQPTGASTE